MKGQSPDLHFKMKNEKPDPDPQQRKKLAPEADPH
jgi:hypothetical protein